MNMITDTIKEILTKQKKVNQLASINFYLTIYIDLVGVAGGASTLS